MKTWVKKRIIPIYSKPKNVEAGEYNKGININRSITLRSKNKLVIY